MSKCGKCCKAGLATDDNMAHARLHAGYLMLPAQTHSGCVTLIVATPQQMVTRMCLIVKLQTHFLSCLYIIVELVSVMFGISNFENIFASF